MLQFGYDTPADTRGRRQIEVEANDRLIRDRMGRWLKSPVNHPSPGERIDGIFKLLTLVADAQREATARDQLRAFIARRNRENWS